jgi:hypothetical protein
VACLRRRISDHSTRCRMVLVSSTLLSSSVLPIDAYELRLVSSLLTNTMELPNSSCRTTLDVRELGIQFGCVRLIPFVQKGLSL